MTVVDYSRLFEHTPHLALRYDPADARPWQIRDQDRDQLYARASTFPQARRFLEAAERKGDATVNWANVALHQSLSASLEITAALFTGSGTEPKAVETLTQSPVSLADDDEPASVPDHFSRRVGTLPEREAYGIGQSGSKRTSGSLIGGDSGGTRPTAVSTSRSGNVLPFRRMSEPLDEVAG